jgi:hypothetical protein
MSPDITMCQDKECPNKDKCYRFIATPDKLRQSYFTESPRLAQSSRRCEHFWPIKQKGDHNK